jgi:hypothetical protein
MRHHCMPNRAPNLISIKNFYSILFEQQYSIRPEHGHCFFVLDFLDLSQTKNNNHPRKTRSAIDSRWLAVNGEIWWKTLAIMNAGFRNPGGKTLTPTTEILIYITTIYHTYPYLPLLDSVSQKNKHLAKKIKPRKFLVK